jgi:hypothetical protein
MGRKYLFETNYVWMPQRPVIDDLSLHIFINLVQKKKAKKRAKDESHKPTKSQRVSASMFLTHFESMREQTRKQKFGTSHSSHQL